ncbi:MAG: UvrD-helicase domain-containing protein [Bacteroidales bacterium]
MINICKASAGSGKTHELTGKYIELLFEKYVSGYRDEGVFFGYRKILAVTFTNKATDEMKQRILSELYDMSEDAVSSDYYSIIKDRFGLNAEQIANDARDMLLSILNDYTAFNVSTIDAFFQKTLRAFAREMGQYSSYEVELDSVSVLSQAVDDMMDSLEDPDKKSLLKWLIDLSISGIEQGDNWNPTNKLKELGTNLFNEDFKLKYNENNNLLTDKQSLFDFRNSLFKIIRDFEANVKSIGTDAMNCFVSAGFMPIEMKGKTRSPFIRFQWMADNSVLDITTSFRKLLDNPDAWMTGKDVSTGVNADFYQKMNGLVKQAIEISDNEVKKYNTAKSVVKDLYALGVLFDIRENILKYCHDNNVVLLSESTEFLNRIIDGSDTPFVYEKIGGRIENYLLDEFQDTSKMQWENFKPLLTDSNDGGSTNLVVGDVKQSIYRWRNSDWNLLNSKVEEDFGENNVNVEILENNWRSAKNIIEFNNDFFSKASDMIAGLYNEEGDRSFKGELIKDIYSTVIQKVPKNHSDFEGHVRINFLPEKNKDVTFNDRVLERLPKTLDNLFSLGYKKSDIVFLVRKNNEGTLLANFLITNNYSVLSDESLLISSSKAVQKIVTALKYVSDDDNEVNKFLFTNKKFDYKERTLFEICEEVCRSLDETDKKQAVFINAFMDLVSNYMISHGSDIIGFCNWWDEAGRSKSISVPSEQDSIRIMTIHKSKGLGFKVVILPFFKLTLNKNRKNVVWHVADPITEAPYDKLGIVPVNISKSTSDTLFSSVLDKEDLYSYIDSLNMAYVAFTRAKEELIIWTPESEKKNKINSVSNILFKLYEDKIKNVLVDSQDIKVLDIGSWWRTETSNETDSKDNIQVSDYESYPIGDRIKLSMIGEDFFDGNNRNRGTIMHNILSEMSEEKDLTIAIDSAIASGVIDQVSAVEFKEILADGLSKIRDYHWFDGTYSHINERKIITETGDFYIPDRLMVGKDKLVVLDYKFGVRHSSYHKQVAHYMKLMESMGYNNIEGYLWYVEDISALDKGVEPILDNFS